MTPASPANARDCPDNLLLPGSVTAHNDLTEASEPADAPTPRVQIGDAYVVSLHKELGDVFGVQLKHSAGVSEITVNQIRSGLIDSWNQSRPDAQVMVGDKIQSVNGVRGPSVAVVLEALFSNNTLEIVFLRGTFSRVSISANEQAQPMSMNIPEDEDVNDLIIDDARANDIYHGHPQRHSHRQWR